MTPVNEPSRSQHLAPRNSVNTTASAMVTRPRPPYQPYQQHQSADYDGTLVRNHITFGNVLVQFLCHRFIAAFPMTVFHQGKFQGSRVILRVHRNEPSSK